MFLLCEINILGQFFNVFYKQGCIRLNWIEGTASLSVWLHREASTDVDSFLCDAQVFECLKSLICVFFVAVKFLFLVLLWVIFTDITRFKKC